MTVPGAHGSLKSMCTPESPAFGSTDEAICIKNDLFRWANIQMEVVLQKMLELELKTFKRLDF